MTPVKDGCTSKNLTCIFARSIILLTQKSTNGALVTLTPAVLPRGYMSISWRRLHENKTVSFSVSWRSGQVSLSIQDHDGADQDNTHCISVYTVQRRLVMAEYRSRHLDKFPLLFPDLRQLRPISVHWHKNWNHQSHVIFDDESRVSLYHSHPLRFWCNNPLSFQQHDEIFENGNNSSMVWPWIHPQISSDGTSADGSSLVLLCQRAVVLPMIWSCSGASVWISWAISSCY